MDNFSCGTKYKLSYILEKSFGRDQQCQPVSVTKLGELSQLGIFVRPKRSYVLKDKYCFLFFSYNHTVKVNMDQQIPELIVLAFKCCYSDNIPKLGQILLVFEDEITMVSKGPFYYFH